MSIDFMLGSFVIKAYFTGVEDNCGVVVCIGKSVVHALLIFMLVGAIISSSSADSLPVLSYG